MSSGFSLAVCFLSAILGFDAYNSSEVKSLMSDFLTSKLIFVTSDF